MQTAKERLSFSGYEWTIKAGARLGPGPNRWEAANVGIDDQKRLRLSIRRDAAGWSCAEVVLTQRLWFGLYEFQTIGPIAKLDPNVVLGLFNYPTPDVGPGTTNEIDIEYAHWGNVKYPIGNFTLWPAKKGAKQVSHTFTPPPDIERATHRFLWLPDRIVWQSLRGHSQDRGDNRGEFARWEYKSSPGSGMIPEKPLRVLLNLWLFQGKAPTDGKEASVTIAQFAHHPS